jgi:hypothetical protein
MATTEGQEQLKPMKLPITKVDPKTGKETKTYDDHDWNGWLIPTHMIELDPKTSAHTDDCGIPGDKYCRCMVRDSDDIGWHAQRLRERMQEYLDRGRQWGSIADEGLSPVDEVRLFWVLVNKVADGKYYVVDNEKFYLIAKQAGNIPFLYCIVHENLDDYEAARLKSGMNATHAVIPFRLWSERDEVRFLTKWFKEFVRRYKKVEPPKTLDEFVHPATEEELQKRTGWVNQFADRFAFVHGHRLWTSLVFGYDEQQLDFRMLQLQMDFVRENRSLPPTRSQHDKDELMQYAMNTVGKSTGFSPVEHQQE